jgi:ubiquinone/menaquinone biosynthesis C-methylase UbiE
MYFPYGKRFAIDPLAEFYLQHFERSRNRAVTYFTAVGEAIPFAQDVFDLVICTNVLDHVVNPQSLLHEVKRTLKSGGIFFLSVDVYPRETYIQRVAREASGEVVDPCHPHTFTNGILKTLVVETGFQVVTDEESASGKGDDSVRYELTLINGKRRSKR